MSRSAERRAPRARPPRESPPAPVAAGPLPRVAFWLGLAGAVALAVFLGLHRVATVRSEPGGLLEDPDAIFHMRRAVRTVAEGRLLPPLFDPGEDFPSGGKAVWPPLHDATLALLLRLGGSTAASPRDGVFVAAALPVLELGICVALAALLVRPLAGERGALLSAWLVALTPAIVRRASYGDVDHNATEMLGYLALLAVASRLARAGPSGPRRDLAAGLAWGVGVLACLGAHAGLVLAAGLVAASHVLLDFVDVTRRGAVSLRLAVGFALAAAALGPLAAVRARPDPADPWRLGPVYVLLLAVAAVPSGLASAWAQARPTASRRWELASALGAALLGAVVLLLQPAAAWSGLARGLGFLGSRDPWLSAIDEFQPMSLSADSLTRTCPALPVGLAAAVLWVALRLRRGAPEGTSGATAVPAGVAFLLAVALAAVQKRFLPPAVLLGAVVAGLAWKDLASGTVRRWIVRGVFGLGVLASLPVTALYVGGTFGQVLRWDDGTNPEAAQVAIALTPPPGPSPAWGILAPWDMGHHLLGVGGRAVALNNFGSWHPGFARKMRILLEPSPARAVSEMTALRLRYLFTVPPLEVVPSTIRSLGLDRADWQVVQPLGDGLPVEGPGSRLERALVVRLHLLEGRPYASDTPEDRAALARFRTRFRSSVAVPGAAVPRLKLFELTDGPSRPE